MQPSFEDMFVLSCRRAYTGLAFTLAVVDFVVGVVDSFRNCKKHVVAVMLLLKHQSRQSLSYVIDVEYKARVAFSSIFQ